MTTFEVFNTRSSHSFGHYKGETAAEAIAACRADAGAAPLEEGQEDELRASQVDLVTIINPFSGAAVERDISRTTQTQVAAYAMLLDDTTLYALEGAESPAAWMAAMVEALGPVEAGRIILGS